MAWFLRCLKRRLLQGDFSLARDDLFPRFCGGREREKRQPERARAQNPKRKKDTEERERERETGHCRRQCPSPEREREREREMGAMELSVTALLSGMRCRTHLVGESMH